VNGVPLSIASSFWGLDEDFLKCLREEVKKLETTGDARTAIMLGTCVLLGYYCFVAFVYVTSQLGSCPQSSRSAVSQARLREPKAEKSFISLGKIKNISS